MKKLMNCPICRSVQIKIDRKRIICHNCRNYLYLTKIEKIKIDYNKYNSRFYYKYYFKYLKEDDSCQSNCNDICLSDCDEVCAKYDTLLNNLKHFKGVEYNEDNV